MASATDELCRMLDERGVEYERSVWSGGSAVWWKDASGVTWRAHDNEDDGLLTLYAYSSVTPEQAIATTLGTEDKIYAVGGIIAQAECHDVCNSVDEFTCSACGFNCDIMSWTSLFDGDVGRHRHHHHGTPNFCPNCGAKVVDAEVDG